MSIAPNETRGLSKNVTHYIAKAGKVGRKSSLWLSEGQKRTLSPQLEREFNRPVTINSRFREVSGIYGALQQR